MLVLSRHIEEAIIIKVPGYPHPIRVMVVDIRDGNKARIGIVAPKEVEVDREEIADAKAKDNRLSAPPAIGGPP